MSAARPTFFATPAAFRAWLEKHHETASELLVGFYKKASGRPSITWPESVDEALCFGWIDGVRRSAGDDSYTIRFTPRKPTSVWSRINVDKVGELTRRGLMRPAGQRAFAARTENKTGVYSFEQRETAELTAAQRRQLRDNARAAAFFDAQPPGYRHIASFWVNSAKQEPTRQRRMERLIADSAAGLRIAPVRRRPKVE